MCAYVSPDDCTLVLFNGINHIKVVSISNDRKISHNYTEVIKLIEFIEQKIVLELDDVYGYLTCKPFNSGSSIEVRALFEDNDVNKFKKVAEE